MPQNKCPIYYTQENSKLRLIRSKSLLLIVITLFVKSSLVKWGQPQIHKTGTFLFSAKIKINLII